MLHFPGNRKCPRVSNCKYSRVGARVPRGSKKKKLRFSVVIKYLGRYSFFPAPLLHNRRVRCCKRWCTVLHHLTVCAPNRPNRAGALADGYPADSDQIVRRLSQQCPRQPVHTSTPRVAVHPPKSVPSIMSEHGLHQTFQ